MRQRIYTKKLIIKNFKSLKDFEVELKKFNLIVGPNGSGKTNIIEAIRLFKAIYSPMARYLNPFLEWWGYKNVVWKGEEHLPVTIGFDMNIANYDAHFEVTITGTGGRFEILREVLELSNILRIEREGSFIKVTHDPLFVEEKFVEEKAPEETPLQLARVIKLSKDTFHNVQSAKIDFSKAIGHPFGIHGWSGTYIPDSDSVVVNLFMPYVNGTGPIYLLTPSIEICREILDESGKLITQESIEPLVFTFLDFIRFGKCIVIRQLDFKELRKPQPIKLETLLNEDCSNLANVFHSLLLQKNEIPRIQEALEAVFNAKMTVGASLTTDGRIYIRVYEKELPLEPPQIADGIWKILAIELAIESQPDLLVIDELENSLHPKAIQYVIDELRRAGCTVIVTTHSPAVVDYCEPDELILLRKNQEGATIASRVANPELAKRWLSEHGLTTSEGWLFRWEATDGY